MGRRGRRIPSRGRWRPPAPPPAPPPTFHLAGDSLRSVGIIRLLLETPTGFAIFSFDGTYLKKDNKDIWSYFVDKLWLHNVIWLKEFLPLENKSTAINLETGDIRANLIEMLKKWCDSKENLVVEKEEYKVIIERNMEITCLYDDDVEEVMWGLKNNMQFLVPEEKTVLTKKVCLPMSKGFEIFLNRYEIDIKPEMVNINIAQLAAILHRIDLALEEHSAFFDLVRESIKSISGIDTTGWSSMKLTITAVMTCHPDKISESGDRSKILSPHERSKIKEDASKYKDVLMKTDTWLIYRSVLFLSEKRSINLVHLTGLIEEAVALIGPQDSEADAADIKSDKTFVMSEPLPIPEKIESNDQTSIAEGQHCLVSGSVMYADDIEGSKLAENAGAKIATEECSIGNVEERDYAKDIGAEGVRAEPIMDDPGEKSTCEDISANQMDGDFDADHVEDQKRIDDASKEETAVHLEDNVEEKKQVQETSADRTNGKEIPPVVLSASDQSMERKESGTKDEASVMSEQAKVANAQETEAKWIPDVAVSESEGSTEINKTGTKDETPTKSKQTQKTSAQVSKTEDIPDLALLQITESKKTVTKGNTSVKLDQAVKTSAKKNKSEKIPEGSTKGKETVSKDEAPVKSKQTQKMNARQRITEAKKSGSKGDTSAKPDQTEETAAKKTEGEGIPDQSTKTKQTGTKVKLRSGKVGLDDQYNNRISRRHKWPWKLLICCHTVQ